MLLGQRKIPEAIREGVEKAGTLVGTALAVAFAALVVACVALVMVLKTRKLASA